MDQDWLMRAALRLAVTAFVMATIALGAWILSRRWRARGAVVAEARAGRTVSSPKIVMVAALAALASLGALVIGLIDGIDESVPNNRLSWVLVIVGFGLAALYAAAVATHRWEWNDEAIAWHGIWRSKRLHWSALAAYGREWSGARYVSESTGAKIRWSDYTDASEALDEAVALHRPDLIERRPPR